MKPLVAKKYIFVEKDTLRMSILYTSACTPLEQTPHVRAPYVLDVMGQADFKLLYISHIITNGQIFVEGGKLFVDVD